jgi:NADH:ubiquinone oxidoreductase subunit K
LTGRPAENQSAPIQADLRPSINWVYALVAVVLLLLATTLQIVAFVQPRPASSNWSVVSVTVAALIAAVTIGITVATERRRTREQVTREAEMATELTDMRQREFDLVDPYLRHLRDIGHDVRVEQPFRAAGDLIVRPGLFDATANEVIEVKVISAPSLANVHRIIQQLLHYRDVTGAAAMALLVPARPASGIIDALNSNGIRVIWPEGEGFTDSL